MPPLATLFSVFFLIAAGAVLLMGGVWSAVMAFRVLYPERPLPGVPDEAARREAMRRLGHTLPVGFREIANDQRRRTRVPAMPRRQVAGPDIPPDDAPLAEELWRRRN
ncbi:MAG TPA: hypothetical protein VD962_08970 [Rubricoccaceae bacterium]|nr:hypothetical protein [Rubricoccaceae bacterium]